MKNEKEKLLAKIAYLYYIEERSQSDIACGWDRDISYTISRNAGRSKKDGIVKIEIEDFDTRLFHLENYVKENTGPRGIEIVSNLVDESPAALEERLAPAARYAARPD